MCAGFQDTVAGIELTHHAMNHSVIDIRICRFEYHFFADFFHVCICFGLSHFFNNAKMQSMLDGGLGNIGAMLSKFAYCINSLSKMFVEK